MDPTSPTPSFYANATEVAGTPFDLHLKFSILAPPRDQHGSPACPTLSPRS